MLHLLVSKCLELSCVIFGPKPSGPNALFILSNDNCSFTYLKVISIWLREFIVDVRRGRSAGSDFPTSSIIDFSAKIRFAFTICNNTISTMSDGQ